MIALARKTLIYEWRRFVPSIFAVGFAGVLLVMQAALVLGIFSTAAIYVNATSADLWVGYPGTQSVNYGRAIGQDVEMRLRMDQGVAEVEPYVWLDGDWRGNDPGEDAIGGVSVYLSGISPAADAMMFDRVLAPWQRQLLREPGAVIVDRADLATLASKEGDVAWINNHKVRIVAVVNGLRGLGGVNVIASIASVREIAGASEGQDTTYLVARTQPGVDAKQVQQRLNNEAGSFGPYEAWEAKDFAHRSQMYWMFNTGAGAGVLFMAIVVCLVGAVVTSQSLRTVIAGSAREYAVLNALGVSRGALGRVVVEQAFWIGAAGMALAVLTSLGLLALAHTYRVPVTLDLKTLLACTALIAVLALISGLGAMRGLVSAEPASLLR